MLAPDIPLAAVVFRTTRSNDWTRAVVGVAFTLASGWAAAAGFDLSSAELSEVRGGGVVVLLRSLIGDGGIRSLLIVCTYLSAAFAAGPVRRRVDGVSALVADEAGVLLHRSFGPATLSWADVVDLRLEGRRPAQVVLTLTHRFWASEKPLTSKQVKMNLVEIGCSYRAAERAIRRMRQWKRQAEFGTS